MFRSFSLFSLTIIICLSSCKRTYTYSDAYTAIDKNDVEELQKMLPQLFIKLDSVTPDKQDSLVVLKILSKINNTTISDEAHVINDKDLLLYALKVRSYKCANALVPYYKSFNIYDSQGSNCLINAILTNKNSLINSLLKKGANPNSKNIKNSNFGIHAAVMSNNKETIDTLLKYGAGIDSIGYRGLTALGMAVNINNLDMVKFLLKRGAKPELQNNEDWNLLQLSIENNNLYMFSYLCDSLGLKVKEADFEIACNHRRFRLIKHIIKNKQITLNQLNNKFITVRDTTLAKILLANSVNINYIDPLNGMAAIHNMCLNGDVSQVQFLIENGAKINLPATQGFIKGYTPLMMSSIFSMGEDNIQPYLNKNIYNYTTTNSSAYQIGDKDLKTSLELVKYLIKKGAKINHYANRKSAISIAEEGTNTAVINYLKSL